jgi:AcrR family transcriptional regulator
MAKSEKTWQAGPLRIRVTAEAPEKRPRERLTRDRIVDAALAQMKEKGYEAVSMRSIAKELGTGQASLYAHVANREELDQLVVDRIAGLLPTPEPDPERWDEQLQQMLLDLVDIYRRHPGAARATLGMIPTQPGAMRTAEAMMALCRAGGVPDQYAAWACDMFSLYVGAVAVEEDVWTERNKAAAAAGRPYTEEAVVDAVRGYLASLPPGEFPILSSLAGVMTTGSGDDRVRFATGLLVAGLKALSQRDA